jgi:hypothetical protein
MNSGGHRQGPSRPLHEQPAPAVVVFAPSFLMFEITGAQEFQFPFPRIVAQTAGAEPQAAAFLAGEDAFEHRPHVFSVRVQINSARRREITPGSHDFFGQHQLITQWASKASVAT